MADQFNISDKPGAGGGGGATVQFNWKFSTNTTIADPGSKTFRYDNADPALVTEIAVNDISNSGVDASVLLAALQVDDEIYIQETADAGAFDLFTVVSVTDETGWFSIVVTVNDSGTLPGNNNDCGWILFYQGGAAGATTFLALTDTPAAYTGQNGHPVRVNNTATALEFATFTTIDKFTANDGIFVGASAASGGARNGHSLILFDDTVNEEIIFEGIIDQFYNVFESLQIVIHWAAASAIVGAVRWIASIENLGAAGQDLDADGFAAGVASTPTTNGTSGVLTYSLLSMTNVVADAIVAGNSYRLKIERDATDGADTMVGDAQILSVNVRMA